MLARLTRCQALADELGGQSMAGPDLLEAICHLKLYCHAHHERDTAMHQALEQFVRASEQCYSLCRTVYQQLYIRVFKALGGEPLDGAVDSVEIDPTSALSLVQAGPVVQITLYNDNETLAKLAPSELLALPNAAEQCDALEEYYDEQALAVEQYERLYDALLQQAGHLQLHAMQVGQQVARCRQALEGLGLAPEHEAVLALSVALDQLDGAICQAVQSRVTQARNCELQVDNACAKFLECGRLKEKLLKSYYTGRARQYHPHHVLPLF